MSGYQVIDLKNYDFVVGTGATIEGVYEKLEGTRKAILLTNIVIAGVEYKDTFVELKGATFTGTVYGYTFSVTSADLVTFANA